MGAFSKELWITIAICVPIIAWTFLVAQSRGVNLTAPIIQVLTLIIGGVIIWRLGGRIVEAVTRIIERIDPTRIWDRAEQHEPSREAIEFSEARTDTVTAIAEVFCQFCGYSIPARAAYCKHCGRKQR